MNLSPVYYDRIKDVPAVVRTLCFNHDAWIVGGAAEYLTGQGKTLPRDWDVIVPLQEWFKVSKIFPTGSVINTLGGVKIKENNTEIDVWADDVGRYFQTVTRGYALLAVSLKTQQVCYCISPNTI